MMWFWLGIISASISLGGSLERLIDSGAAFDGILCVAAACLIAAHSWALFGFCVRYRNPQ